MYGYLVCGFGTGWVGLGGVSQVSTNGGDGCDLLARDVLYVIQSQVTPSCTENVRVPPPSRPKFWL